MSTKPQPNMLIKLFPLLGEKSVNLRTELLAGLTTFLTMAYIIAINPSILSEAGMDAGALVTGTCLAAALGCFLMGFIANLPFGLASGMGLNAFFAYSVVLAYDIPWQVALTAVFVEGIIFILLTACKVREAVVNAIPLNMKLAVTGGIGLSDLFYQHFARFARDFSVLTFDYQMPFADNSEFARHRSRAAHAVRGRRHLHHGLPRGFDRPDVRHRRGHRSRQRPPGADGPVEGIRRTGV